MSEAVRRAVKAGRKSHLIFSAGLMAIVAGVFACSDSPQSPVEPSSAAATTSDRQGSANPNAFVGEGHNAMVDAVLRDVSRRRAMKGPRKVLCKEVKDAAIEYVRAHAQNPGEAVQMVQQQKFCTLRTASAGRVSQLRAGLAEEYGLSARAVELLNATNYYTGISFSAAELSGYLAPIDAAAAAELNWEEAQIVTSATAVAVSSLDYWNANLASWGAQFQPASAYLKGDGGFSDVPLTPRHSFWPTVWDIAKADLDGAIGGGVAAKLAKTAIPEAAIWIGGSKSLVKLIELL